MAVRPSSPAGDPESLPWHRLVAVLFVSLVCATALFAVPIAAGPIGGGTETDSDRSIAFDIASGTSIGDDDELIDSNGTALTDDQLPNDETVELVVRLDDPPIEDVPEDHVEDELEAYATETQEPLLEYAAETPGLTVEEAFWVTNAVVVTVDTAVAEIDPLTEFADVDRIHENFDVPVPDQPSVANATETIDPAEETMPDRSAGDDGNSDTDDGGDATAQTASETPTTWGINYIDAPAVWDAYDTRGEGVRVAVLDTGVDASHPDIDLYTEDPDDPTYPGGWAEFDENGDRVTGSTPYDSGTHGTHVTGTVAGGAASGTQIGVAPDVEVLHGLVLTETSGSFAQVVAGMEWAVERDADIASMSLGVEGQIQSFVAPVRNANESGTIVVGAIGNEGHETSSSPGNVYEAISVGAVDWNGEVASFSGGEHLNRSDWRAPPETWPDSYTVPDMVAPGVSIASAVPGNAYGWMPGTSMATPHVSGTIALMLSVEPDASLEEIEAALIETTWLPDDPDLEAGVDPATRYGHGIVDAKGAVDHLSEPPAQPEPETATGDGEDDSDPSPISPGTIVLAVAIGLLGVLAALAFGRDR